jgi:CheY-like chemotaxis protein
MPGAGDEALRAPLQGLIGALDLLAEADNEEERRDWLAVARACADELAVVLGDEATAPLAARPLSILVAEDVETNRVVIGALLGRAGHRVEFAPDGRAAVAAAARGGFDAILMDMLMPELDGLGATQAIRALPAQQGRVPIIGLSAYASAEDRARSLAAGLDEHLSKPVDREALLACLARVVQPAGALDAAALARLRIDVGAEQYGSLLAEYRQEIGGRLAAVAAPDALDDPIGLARTAHDLKGCAAAIGAAALAAAAAALEAVLREGGGDPAARRDALLAEQAPAMTALDAVIANAGAD